VTNRGSAKASLTRSTLSGHVISGLARFEPSPRPAEGDMTITIVLRRTDQAGFDEFLAALSDPGSSNYRRYLSQRELADRFGPSPSVYAGTLDFLTRHGFLLVEGSANRLTLTVRGSRAQAEQAFGVSIRDFKDGERIFHASLGEPVLPEAIGRSVQAVIGLNNLATPESNLRYFFIPTSGFHPRTSCGPCFHSTWDCDWGWGPPPPCGPLDCPACESPTGCACPYGVPDASCDPPPSPWSSVNGSGQKIGLLEFDNFSESDVTDYL